MGKPDHWMSLVALEPETVQKVAEGVEEKRGAATAPQSFRS